MKQRINCLTVLGMIIGILCLTACSPEEPASLPSSTPSSSAPLTAGTMPMTSLTFTSLEAFEQEVVGWTSREKVVSKLGMFFEGSTEPYFSDYNFSLILKAHYFWVPILPKKYIFEKAIIDGTGAPNFYWKDKQGNRYRLCYGMYHEEDPLEGTERIGNYDVKMTRGEGDSWFSCRWQVNERNFFFYAEKEETGRALIKDLSLKTVEIPVT